MCAIQASLEIEPIDEVRKRLYDFLAALLSHPDEGNWGCALRAAHQRELIRAADRICEDALAAEYPVLCDELPAGELDLRPLVLELCQPLEHLREEFERVFCVQRVEPACSPFELNHRDGADGTTLAESTAELIAIYRSCGFDAPCRPGRRPDHLSVEFEFLCWLIARKRLTGPLARVDSQSAREVAFYDLAQRNFFGDHLSDWVASFGAGLQRHCGAGYLDALGRFLAAWVPFERHHLGVEPGLQERACVACDTVSATV
jgi:TorA maturation chaperone TorD